MLENPTKSIVFHGCFDGNHPRSSEDISGYMNKCILESPKMVAWKVWLQPGLSYVYTNVHRLEDAK